jgi:hypothetical protein
MFGGFTLGSLTPPPLPLSGRGSDSGWFGGVSSPSCTVPTIRPSSRAASSTISPDGSGERDDFDAFAHAARSCFDATVASAFRR